MASTWIKRDLSVSETVYKYTWSAWIKRASLGVAGSFFKTRIDGNNWVQAYLHSDNSVVLQSYKNGGYHYDFKTTQKFRDTNSWYHFVFNVDSSQSTTGDRVRIYVNGERITDYATSNNNLTNGDTLIINGSDNGQAHSIGSWNNGTYFDGCMSHVHYSSGYSYAPTVFGETDTTTGEWKIKTNPTFTLGGNGYTVLKDGNTITDQSSNSNDFTVGGGTLTKTEDNPSNVFATLNPLIPMRGTPTYQSGNTYFRSDYSAWDSALSTIGATSGKWYFEAKWGNQDNLMIGCVDVDKDPEFLSGGHTYGYVGFRGISYFGETSNPRVIGNNNNDLVTGLTTFASGDIIGCAIDLDNREMFVHRNGTYTNSGNPATRANPYNMSTSINQGGTVLMGVASRSGYGIEVNFGNGYFSSTAISSAGTNASGIGIFEYDVPSGFTALSTKGLNE